MFSKGSRYRNLPESTPVNAEGERLRGKDLRLIPPTLGRFLHAVREGDRLGLLAFKYYGDATKWWQISDANPETAFPLDLLDGRPLVEERLVLTPVDFNTRFTDLLTALNALGAVQNAVQDFLESTVLLVYDPTVTARQQILNQIQVKGFHFLRAFAWTIATDTAEAFTFDDLAVKENWQKLVDGLAAMPGVPQVQSILTTATLHLAYNSAMVNRGAILSKIQTAGFALMPESAAFSRSGAKIIVPPNQIV
jgi:hypothetical protein